MLIELLNNETSRRASRQAGGRAGGQAGRQAGRQASVAHIEFILCPFPVLII